MSEMEDKLNAILSNPQMMQQIMSMAHAMGQDDQSPPPQSRPEGIADIDVGMLKRISGLTQGAAVDKNQQTLLHALGPYLSKDRIHKLEKAMRAAKMAKLASGFLSQQGILTSQGR